MVAATNFVLFKVKASNQIGMGHISRCASLLSLLPTSWSGILMVNNDSKVQSLATQYPWIVVDQNDFSVFDNYLIQCLIYDQNENDAKFLEKVKNKKLERVIALDYFNYNHPPVDVIINLFDQGDEEKRLNQKSKYYEGLQYAIINKRFGPLRKKRIHPNKIQRILILLGGADPTFKTIQIIQKLVEWNVNSAIDIVLGPLYAKYEETIYASNGLHGEVSIHKNPKDLPALMAKADLAFSGCATTFFELSFLGTPSIIFSQNKKEYRFCMHLESSSIALHGDDRPEEAWLQMQSQETRTRISDRQMSVFDGKGPQRILKLSGII